MRSSLSGRIINLSTSDTSCIWMRMPMKFQLNSGRKRVFGQDLLINVNKPFLPVKTRLAEDSGCWRQL